MFAYVDSSGARIAVSGPNFYSSYPMKNFSDALKEYQRILAESGYGDGPVSGAMEVALRPLDCSDVTPDSTQAIICDTPVLSALNEQLNHLFARARLPGSDNDEAILQSTQTGWERIIRVCLGNSNPVDCMKYSYESRITELQIRNGVLEVPTPVIYGCAGGDDFTAVFYAESMIPAAVFTFLDQQFLALIAPSGSGARYTTPGFEYWGKGSEATVSGY